MKIGEFAKRNDTTVDTIRHYMKLGLIVPKKIDINYDFDELCQGDLNKINNLKELGFSLIEIKNIIYLEKLGKLTDYEQDVYYQSFFVNKYKDIAYELEKLSEIKNKLGHKINLFNNNVKDDKGIQGIDIKMLDILACHKCGEELVLEGEIVYENKIMNGVLLCSCGSKYMIEEGIVYGWEIYNNQKNSTKVDRALISYDYVKETNIDYVGELVKGLEWFKKNEYISELDGKNILDLGSGDGYDLRYFYNNIMESTNYIAVDHNSLSQRVLKGLMDKKNEGKNILFLCCDFGEIPLKRKSVDLVVDGWGSSCYAFENKDFLLGKISKYVKEKSKLVASYIIFKKYKLNSILSLEYRDNFNLRKIKEEISYLGYEILEEKKGQFLEVGGKYDNYFLEGEKVYFYFCYAKL